MNIAIEPKQREPRKRSLVDTTSSALLMCLEADRDDLGITIDVGHVYQAGMNVSQNIEIAAKYNKIFNFHVNDNYGSLDDDMMLGSVRFIENIEMFYTLEKIGYNKYLSVDIFPFRDKGIAATRESILYMKKYNEIVNRIGFDELKKLIDAGDFTEVLRVVRNEVFSF